MSRAATTPTVGDQITTLLTGFTLTTAAREMVSRFVQAEQQPALPLLLDVLELEAEARHERRITRLRRALARARRVTRDEPRAMSAQR